MLLIPQGPLWTSPFTSVLLILALPGLAVIATSSLLLFSAFYLSPLNLVGWPAYINLCIKLEA